MIDPIRHSHVWLCQMQTALRIGGMNGSPTFVGRFSAKERGERPHFCQRGCGVACADGFREKGLAVPIGVLMAPQRWQRFRTLTGWGACDASRFYFFFTGDLTTAGVFLPFCLAILGVG